MLCRLLVLAALLSCVNGFTNCTHQSRSLRRDRVNVALMRGIMWPDQSSRSTNQPPSNDFHLCMQVANGPYLHVQLDTGSTGIVVSKHFTGSIDQPINTPAVCQSFLYDSSDNAYWGPMLHRSVTLFGGDDDGRFLRVGPIDSIDQSIGMPLLSVEYICQGADCLSILNGDRPSTNDCAYVRDRLMNNVTVQRHWRATTLDDSIAMLGVGYDRGAAAEGYTFPVPMSRNAALRINASTLSSVRPVNQPTGQSNSSLPCYSNVDATGLWPCDDLGACDQPAYQYQCIADAADPTFTVGSTNQYYPIGYVITRERFIPLIAPPNTPSITQSTSQSINPISQSNLFSCVSLPAFPANAVNGQPGYTCYNANAVQGQNELRPINQSTNQLGNAIYAAHGSMLPDTGIQYEIFEPRPKPLIDANLDQLITFRFPVLPNQPTNVNCSINQAASSQVAGSTDCMANSWSFIAHLGNETRINHVGGYYPTDTYQSTNQSPPTYVRFINNSAVSIPHDQALNQSMFINTGRFLLTDFMYYVNLQSGVVGFAPFVSTDDFPDTVIEVDVGSGSSTATNEAVSRCFSTLLIVSLALGSLVELLH